MTEKDGLTVAQARERYPNMMRLLEQVGLDNGLEICADYRFQRIGIEDELTKAERFAATIDWDDDEAIECILTVDCDRYDELVMDREFGPIADSLIADLYDGRDRVDFNGRSFFRPCYAKWLRMGGER